MVLTGHMVLTSAGIPAAAEGLLDGRQPVSAVCIEAVAVLLVQQAESSVRGDPSEDFKFSSFFPDALSRPIDAVAGTLARVFR
jgi:hypothetical protein